MKKIYTALAALLVLVFASAAISNAPMLRADTDEPAADDAGEWTDLGTATIVDDCFTVISSYSLDNYSFEAPIQESTTTPGLYRVVDPYLKYPFGGHDSEVQYLIIHAENPDQVYFEEFSTGVTIGAGYHHIRSIAAVQLAEGKTAEEVAAAGLFGKLVDGVITMPAESMEFQLNSNWYPCNKAGLWSVTLPKPEWEPVGEGLYTEDCFSHIKYGGTPLGNYTFAVTIEKSGTTEGLYRLVEPYKNLSYGARDTDDTYMIVHAENPDQVWIEHFDTGVNISLGSMQITSVAADMFAEGKTADEIAEAGMFGRMSNGEITMPANSLKTYYPSRDMWTTSGVNGKFLIQFPKEENKITWDQSELDSKTFDAGQIIELNATATSGAPVTYTIQYRESGTTGWTDEVAEDQQTPIAELIDGNKLKINRVGDVRLEASSVSTPEYYLPESVTKIVKVQTVVLPEWVAVGEGLYTEDCFSHIKYGGTPLGNYTFAVTIEKSGTTEGLYRLVEPYKNLSYGARDTDDTYMIVHAENPDQVWIEHFDTGVNISLGSMQITSVAADMFAEGKTADEIAEAGMFGRMSNGEITMPANSLKTYYPSRDMWTTSGVNGKFLIQFPKEENKITWDQSELDSKTFDAGQIIELNATATSGAPVTYTIQYRESGTTGWTDEVAEDQQTPIAELIDGNKLKINRVGDVRLEASSVSTPDYYLPESVTKIVKAQTVVLPEWMPMGKATFTDDCLTIFAGYNPRTWDVDVEKNTQTEGIYRLVDPYNTWPGGGADDGKVEYLVIHAENPSQVYFDEHDTGKQIGFGYMVVGSLAADALANGETPEQIAAKGLFGKAVSGNITMPVKSTYTFLPNYQGGTRFNSSSSGAWKVKLPGALDLSFDITNFPSCTHDGMITFPISSTGVADVKYLVEEGNKAMSDVNYQRAATEGISAGNTESITIDMNDKPAGHYTIFFAAVDEEGNYIKGEGSFFWALPEDDDQDNWEYKADAVFNAGDFTPQGYTISGWVAEPTTVELEENVNTPGYYRLKNPFGPETCFANWKACSDSHNHYLYVHAEDPDKVWIEKCPTGIRFSTSAGDAIICSYANNIAASDYGTLADRKITFPDETILLGQMNESRSSMTRTNRAGKNTFSIEIAKFANWIEWDQSAEFKKSTYDKGELIELTATSQSGQVNYSLGYKEEGETSYSPNVAEGQDTPIAEIVEQDGKSYLKVNREGSIRISASAPETEEYQPAMPVNKFMTIQQVNGIENVLFDNNDTDATYFTPQGVRVSRPMPGQVVIMVKNGQATKILVK